MIAGVISAAIEFVVLIALVEYRGISYLNSNIIAFTLTNVVNYVLSRTWVFGRSRIKKRIELPMFLFFLLCGLGISQTTLWILVTYAKLDYRIAKVVAVGFVVVWNYTTRRHVVFNSSFHSRRMNVQDEK